MKQRRIVGTGGSSEMRCGPMGIKVGSWRCPSGNSVDVFFERDPNGVGHLFCAWDSPPPLSPEDHAYYLAVILPEAQVQALSLKPSGP